MVLIRKPAFMMVGHLIFGLILGAGHVLFSREPTLNHVPNTEAKPA